MKKNPKQKTVEAFTVIFGEKGYAKYEITYWSADLHPIFTKRKHARDWARELFDSGALNTRCKVVPCTITYQPPKSK